jgi:hypothetical protein
MMRGHPGQDTYPMKAGSGKTGYKEKWAFGPSFLLGSRLHCDPINARIFLQVSTGQAAPRGIEIYEPPI